MFGKHVLQIALFDNVALGFEEGFMAGLLGILIANAVLERDGVLCIR